jgi:hypothetical protein
MISAASVEPSARAAAPAAAAAAASEHCKPPKPDDKSEATARLRSRFRKPDAA